MLTVSSSNRNSSQVRLRVLCEATKSRTKSQPSNYRVRVGSTVERRGGVNTREQEEGIRGANIWNQSVCKRVKAVYMGRRNNEGERKKRKNRIE